MSGINTDSEGPHATALNKIRAACLKRGPAGIKSFSRTFRIFDDSGNKQLERDELKKGLTEYNTGVTDEELDGLMNFFDADNSGTISFDEFVQMLRPPMRESRLKLIREAFKKADKTGDGVLTPADLKKVYNARKHPKYMNGEWDETRVFQEFLKTFEPDESCRDGKVTLDEFIAYYSGVSASIDEDAYFDLMMRNAWKL